MAAVLLAVILVFLLLLALRGRGESAVSEGARVLADASTTELPTRSGGTNELSTAPYVETKSALGLFVDDDGLVDAYRLGQQQRLNPDYNSERVPYGEIGSHCFVGEECPVDPSDVADLNARVGGTGGLLGGLTGGGAGGVVGGATGAVGGGGITIPGLGAGSGSATPSGSSSGGTTSGGSGASAGESRNAANDARRVPQGEIGAHCFVGEVCPEIRSGGGDGDGVSGTRRGEIVPCGEIGVHSRVGEDDPCTNGVLRRVGSLPAEIDPERTPTVTADGLCYRIIEADVETVLVRRVACPDDASSDPPPELDPPSDDDEPTTTLPTGGPPAVIELRAR